MAASTGFLPGSRLPPWADTRNHPSVPAPQLSYEDYPHYVAAAHGPETLARALSHRSSASVIGSSVKDRPLKYKWLLGSHKILLLVLAVVFEISLLAVTVAIVLGAVYAHRYGGLGGVKTMIVCVGVFGTVGVIGSAAVAWLLWQGRKMRARLEKRFPSNEKTAEQERGLEIHGVAGIGQEMRDETNDSRSSSQNLCPGCQQRRERIPLTHRPSTSSSSLAPPHILKNQRSDIESWGECHLDLDNSSNEERDETDEKGFEGPASMSPTERLNRQISHEIITHVSSSKSPRVRKNAVASSSKVRACRSPTFSNINYSPIDGPGSPRFPANQVMASSPMTMAPNSPTSLYSFRFPPMDGPVRGSIPTVHPSHSFPSHSSPKISPGNTPSSPTFNLSPIYDEAQESMLDIHEVLGPQSPILGSFPRSPPTGRNSPMIIRNNPKLQTVESNPSRTDDGPETSATQMIRRQRTQTTSTTTQRSNQSSPALPSSETFSSPIVGHPLTPPESEIHPAYRSTPPPPSPSPPIPARSLNRQTSHPSLLPPSPHHHPTTLSASPSPFHPSHHVRASQIQGAQADDLRRIRQMRGAGADVKGKGKGKEGERGSEVEHGSVEDVGAVKFGAGNRNTVEQRRSARCSGNAKARAKASALSLAHAAPPTIDNAIGGGDTTTTADDASATSPRPETTSERKKIGQRVRGLAKERAGRLKGLGSGVRKSLRRESGRESW